MIAVVGPGDPDPKAEEDAMQVGRLIAEAGAALLCGGMQGAMTAACRGAKQAGGLTIGLLPGREKFEANPYVDITLPTGMGEARNVLIARAADGMIAIGGGFGTLSEMAMALKLGRPLVALGTWEFSKSNHPVELPRAKSPAEAVAMILELIDKGS